MAKSGEEDYGCALNEDARTIARVELREDDAIREQALDQFRHWIQKHPAIKRCRTDAAFLLRFLRTKKFSVPMAEEMLERYLTIRQLYPNWFQNLDIEDPDIEAIIDAGYLVPLMERDHHGRRVILSCAGKDHGFLFHVRICTTIFCIAVLPRSCFRSYTLRNFYYMSIVFYSRTLRSVQVYIRSNGSSSQLGSRSSDGRRGKSGSRLHVHQRRVRIDDGSSQRLVSNRYP